MRSEFLAQVIFKGEEKIVGIRRLNVGFITRVSNNTTCKEKKIYLLWAHIVALHHLLVVRLREPLCQLQNPIADLFDFYQKILQEIFIPALESILHAALLSRRRGPRCGAGVGLR